MFHSLNARTQGFPARHVALQQPTEGPELTPELVPPKNFSLLWGSVNGKRHLFSVCPALIKSQREMAVSKAIQGL